MKELWKELWKPFGLLLLAASIYVIPKFWHPEIDLEDKLFWGGLALYIGITWDIFKAEQRVHERLTALEEKIDELQSMHDSF